MSDTGKKHRERLNEKMEVILEDHNARFFKGPVSQPVTAGDFDVVVVTGRSFEINEIISISGAKRF